MENPLRPRKLINLAILAAVVSLAFFAVFGAVWAQEYVLWSGPTAPPPGNNINGLIFNRDYSRPSQAASINIDGGVYSSAFCLHGVINPETGEPPYCISDWRKIISKTGDYWALDDTRTNLYTKENENFENWRLGLGTETPAVKLEVSDGTGGTAQIRITDTAQNPELQLQYGAGKDNDHWAFYADQSDKSLKVWSCNPDVNGNCDVIGNRLTILQNGNVGIGATDPGQKLDIAGALRVRPSTEPAGDNGVIYYNSTENKFKCYESGAWINCVGAGTGAGLPPGTLGQTLRHDGASWVANSFLYNNGAKISIGNPPNTEAGFLLDAGSSNTDLNRIRVYNSNLTLGGADFVADNSVGRMRMGALPQNFVPNAANSGFKANSGFIDANNTLSGGLSVIARSGTGDIRFYSGGNADANERIRITSAGKVGIGTTAPAEKLQVMGNISLDPAAAYNIMNINALQGLASGDLKIQSSLGAENKKIFYGASEHQFWTSGIQRLIIDSAGNVGISMTPEAAAKLTVGGQIKITGGGPGTDKVLTSSDAAGLAVWKSLGELGGISGDHGALTGLADDDHMQYLLIDGSRAMAGNLSMAPAGSENDIININRLIGNNDLFIKGNGPETAPIFYGASEHQFWTKNSGISYERMRIDNLGNVGIGTAAPTAKLEVNGQVKITDGSQGPDKVLASDATGLASWKNLSDLGGGNIGGAGTLNYVAKFTPDGAHIGNSSIFDNGANVGIGTAAPKLPLHVFKGSAGTYPAWSSADVALFENALGQNTVVQLFTDNAKAGVLQFSFPAKRNAAQIFYNYANGIMGLQNNKSGTDITAIAIDSNGKVGIGTTAPAEKLQVMGNISLDPAAAYNIMNINALQGLASGDLKIQSSLGAENKKIFYGASEHQFWTSNAQRLTIDSAGNVGIGVIPDPLDLLTKLNINGQIKITGGSPGDKKVLTSDVSGLASWQALPAANNVHGALTGLADDDHPQYLLTNGTRVMTGNLNVAQASGENNIINIDELVGYNDLFVKGNGLETAPIYYGASEHQFWTKNSGISYERMRIDNLGNVGIGVVPDPLAKLDIFGKIKIVDTTQGLNKVLASDATGLASWKNLSDLGGGNIGGAGTLNYVAKFTPDGAHIGNSSIFDNGANVGIGTNVPAAVKLEVKDDTTAPTKVRITDTAENPELQLQYGAGDEHWGIYDKQSDDSLNIWSNNGGGTNAGDRLTILQNGYVGIGITAPNNLLQVAGLIKFDDTSRNTLLGKDAFSNDNGGANTGVGWRAGVNNKTSPPTCGTGGASPCSYGTKNTYIGREAGKGGALGATEYSGGNNVAVGASALSSITTGSSNVAVGASALQNNTSGGNNVAVGSGDEGNTVLGGAALQNNTTGVGNVAIGGGAASNNITGGNNVAIGVGAANNNTTGAGNIVIGKYAHLYSDTGDNNTVIGTFADGRGWLTNWNNQQGRFDPNFFLTPPSNSRSNNTIIGDYAGFNNVSGSNNVFLGHNAGYNQTTASNLLIIDNAGRGTVNSPEDATKSLIYGVFNSNPANQKLTFNANVGIGTNNTDVYKLNVNGDLNVVGSTYHLTADYAEWFEKEETAKLGDLIGLNLKTGKARKYRAGDKFIGIHSANPAIVGGQTKETKEEMAKTHILVGLLGQLEFDKSQTIIKGGLVQTKDGQEVGVLLANGKVLLGR